ncbi:hypothetical protein [Nitrosarchaeum sp. AC2]|uniref:hypothetical protein n=1 Tax=Nitrosarchaeum sp. AC2 TaxID=2259673 RepID=UPI0015C8D531|nr:hypothetical protein [Nitrosarchaeum sp. AC2]QLH11505.1 hypothetical protein DSQ20_08700 [Nitrosarchaeum sp. AC2]
MKIKIRCDDKYEAQKLSSLLFIKDMNETFITAILNIFDNEIVVALKDKSAHSILLKDKVDVDVFVDFIQSVIEKEHKIVSTVMLDEYVEIGKE